MRKIKCQGCGKEIDAIKSICFCDECRIAKKRSSVYRERICINCGALFWGYPKSKRCESCAYEKKKEADRESKKRERKGITRKLGSVDKCEKCGAEYTVNAPLQKYCEKCKAKAAKERINEHKRIYMSERKDVNKERKAERVRSRKICLICKKQFYADTPRTCCSEECGAKRKRMYWEKAERKKICRQEDYDRMEGEHELEREFEL